jgi:thiol-disulfide isomerase/thioredoxin
LLAQEVVRKYAPRVSFVVQDLGASPLAENYGVDKYPAIFVDDALVARPEDFYAWGGPPTGKYLPWKEEKSRVRFQNDLARMIDIRLAGGTVESLQLSPSSAAPTLPKLEMVDLDGRKVTFDQLRGKKVVVEFWATWCPYCIDTLGWLRDLKAPDVEVVGIAIDSERKDVESLIAQYRLPGRHVMATPAMRDAFNGPPAVPTMLLIDRNGTITRVFYGAPKNLHAEIEHELNRM